MAAGLNGVLIASDLFNLFVFSELAVIAAYIFASFFDEAENFEAAFKYAVMGSLSSLLILLAFALLYSRTGSLNMLAIAAHEGSRQTVFDLLVLVLLIAGFGLKSTLVPFHAWVPDAYAAAPSPVTALYSGAVSKVVGIYVLMRMAFNVIGITPAMLHIFTLLGIISMLVGVTLALYQWDFKRLLAYHSISQIGYIVLGIGLGTPLGIIGGLFHLLNHSVFKSLLFMNAGSIERAAETRNLKELGGLSARMPVTAGTSLVASMSISGIPPLNGFWSKLVIIIACVQARQYWFAFFAALASILTLSSFLKVQRYAFFGYLKDALKDIREAPAVMTVPMLLLAALCISLGLLLVPGLDRYFLGLAANTLLAGRDFSALFIRVTP
jgi:multicomponent Na+:H+ antiporter subunit D